MSTDGENFRGSILSRLKQVARPAKGIIFWSLISFLLSVFCVELLSASIFNIANFPLAGLISPKFYWVPRYMLVNIAVNCFYATMIWVIVSVVFDSFSGEEKAVMVCRIIVSYFCIIILFSGYYYFKTAQGDQEDAFEKYSIIDKNLSW